MIGGAEEMIEVGEKTIARSGKTIGGAEEISWTGTSETED